MYITINKLNVCLNYYSGMALVPHMQSWRLSGADKTNGLWPNESCFGNFISQIFLILQMCFALFIMSV
jgi:hypothetical protein